MSAKGKSGLFSGLGKSLKQKVRRQVCNYL